MTDLLMRVLQNSVIASFLFLIIQWLRPVLKQYRYSMFRTLWIVLILFLLIPVDISIPNITHELKVETEYVEPLISGTVLNEVEIIINHEDSNENESLEIVVPQQSTQDETSYSISNVFKQLSLVDLTGFSFISISLILAAFQLFTFFWFHRLLLMSGQRIGGKEVPWIMSDLVDSPLLTGLVHPVIALPADIVDHPHLEMMIEHEMMHYQKKDLLMKFLMLLAKCIHWFNPIVYLMEKQLSKDLEMACDEEVLKNADEEKKQIYAQTLLDMVCKTRFSKEAFTTQFSSDDFKMRIRNVFDTGRNKVGKLIVVFVFGIITGISVLFSVELFSDSISQLTVYQVKESEKAEYAVVSGESAALLTESFSGIDYIRGTFAAKKQWAVTIDKNLYEFSFFNDGIVVWRNTEEYKILQNTSDIELIRTILKIQDHSTDSQKEDNPQSNNQNKYSSEEEQYFVEKGYLNALNGLNQFNERSSASFSQYTLQLQSPSTLVKYTYYDLLMEFYCERSIECEIEEETEALSVVLAISLKEGFTPYLDGTVRTSKDDLISFSYNPSSQKLTGFEKIKALGMSDTENVKKTITDLFSKSWNQANLQYQLLRAWHEEFNSVQHEFKEWDDIINAETVEIDL